MRGKGVKLNGKEEEGWQEEEIEERRNRGGDLRRCGDTLQGKGVRLDGEEEEEGRQEEIKDRGGDLRRCGDTLQGKGVRLDGEEERQRCQEEEIRMMPRWGGLPPAVFIIMEIIGAEGGRGIEARHTKRSG